MIIIIPTILLFLVVTICTITTSGYHLCTESESQSESMPAPPPPETTINNQFNFKKKITTFQHTVTSVLPQHVVGANIS